MPYKKIFILDANSLAKVCVSVITAYRSIMICWNFNSYNNLHQEKTRKYYVLYSNNKQCYPIRYNGEFHGWKSK